MTTNVDDFTFQSKKEKKTKHFPDFNATKRLGESCRTRTHTYTHARVIFVYYTNTTPVVPPKAKLLFFFFFLNPKRMREKHGEGPPQTPHKGSHGGRGGGGKSG